MTEHLNQIVKLLKLDVLDKNQSLLMVKQKTGVNPSVITLAIGVFLSVCLMISSATSSFVIAIACYVIPAYFTFVALQSHQKQMDIKFLTYWIVFALLEMFSPILSFLITPGFYALARIGLTFASIHPAINLSGQIYHQVVQPFFLQNQSKIDRNLNKAEGLLNQGQKKLVQAFNQISGKNQ